MAHISVLLQEAISYLHLQHGNVVVDGTLGAGGHSRAICKKIGPEGTLIAFDADSTALAHAQESFTDDCTVRFVCENFRNIGAVLDEMGIDRIDGALLDIGLSSTLLEESGRGFSFAKDEPLLMTFTAQPYEGDVTARVIVNEWEEENIADILFGFGEERYARRIAKGIVNTRAAQPIETTFELVEVIRGSVPKGYLHAHTHFATRTFQALRMAVNDELGALTSGIEASIAHLRTGGRLVVIDFHSIEDRLVKNLFKEKAKEGVVEIITKKPIVPSTEEIKENKRSRSAKMRVVEKK